MPTLTFDHIEPIALNVRSVDIRNEESGYEGNFFIAPSAATEAYLRKRFSAIGQVNALEAVIEEASVTKKYVPSQKGVRQYFKVDGIDEYTVVLKLRLAHQSEYGRTPYSSDLTVQRVINISEHASIVERERRQLEGLEGLIDDLDREVRRVVVQDMELAFNAARNEVIKGPAPGTIQAVPGAYPR